MYVDITVRDFIENIRKNGLPKVTGGFFKYEESSFADLIENEYSTNKGKIIAACAFGQGLINSGAIYEFEGEYDDIPNRLFRRTYTYNDDFDWTFAQIADRLLEVFEIHLDTYIRFRAVDYTDLVETAHAEV